MTDVDVSGVMREADALRGSAMMYGYLSDGTPEKTVALDECARDYAAVERAARFCAIAFAEQRVKAMPCSMANLYKDDTRECDERIGSGEEVAMLKLPRDMPLTRDEFHAEMAKVGAKPTDYLERRPWDERDRCYRCRELASIAAMKEQP